MNKNSFPVLFASTLLLSIICLPLQADVTVVRLTKSGGFGGMGAFDAQQTEYIQGLKKREESVHKFTGRILGRLTKAKKSVVIFRVDKDLIWDMDVNKKTYSERPISLPEEDKELFSGSGQEDEPEGAMAEDEEQSSIKVIRNELTVEETGKEKNINGFDTRQIILSWIIETEDMDTGQRSKTVMTSEMWNTGIQGAVSTLMKEEQTFNTAYLEKLGLEMTPEQMKRFGFGVLGGLLSASSEELEEKMSRIEGYPIVTRVKWQQSIEGGEAAPQVEEEDEAPQLSTDISGMLGSFIKKAVEKNASKKKDKDGMKPLFESYTEIKRIDDMGLDDDMFVVPGSYRKTGS